MIARKGLNELLDRLGDEVDHFEMLEDMETKLFKVAEALRRFNTDFSEMSKSRKDLPSLLAEIKVLSEVLVFKLGMHMGEFEEEINNATQSLINEIPTSDDNYTEMEF